MLAFKNLVLDARARRQTVETVEVTVCGGYTLLKQGVDEKGPFYYRRESI
jgi:hypothetical protein